MWLPVTATDALSSALPHLTSHVPVGCPASPGPTPAGANAWSCSGTAQQSTCTATCPTSGTPHQAVCGANGQWVVSGGPCLQLLYSNGDIVTNPGAGAGGADVSNTLGDLIGATCNTEPWRLGDGFSVTGVCGWTIHKIRLYAFQFNSGTTSTLTFATVRIWSGAPWAGGQLVFGGAAGTTNRLTVWTNIYRTADNACTNTQRPIMYVDIA